MRRTLTAQDPKMLCLIFTAEWQVRWYMSMRLASISFDVDAKSSSFQFTWPLLSATRPLVSYAGQFIECHHAIGISAVPYPIIPVTGAG